MNTVALSSVAEINPPGPRGDAFDPGTNLDFVPMAAVGEDGRMEVVEQRPYRELMKGYTAFRQSDVLVAKITPCFENNKIALATVATDYAFGSTEFHVIRCSPGELHPPYLTHFLRKDRIRQAGERRMTGSAGQRRVPTDFLEKLEVPLPPLAEQERIAAILDQADSLRRLRQRAIDRLNSLGQGIFCEMFGDLKSNSKSFRMQLLSDLIYVRGGFSFPSSDFGEVGHPVVRISNIDGETVLIDGSARIEENRLGKGKTFEVNEGDILIAMSGATTGKIGVMPSYAGPVYLNQRVGRYEIKLKDRIDPSYLRLLVKSDFYQSRILERAWGAAQPNVSGPQLVSFEAPIPPMEMQEVFANRLRALELCKTASSNALQKAKILFSSLQQRAFRGEL